MKNWLSAGAFICTILGSLATKANRFDSLGVENRNGKQYVIHQVDPKETLYGISKRYQTSIEVIQEENPAVAVGLKIGQRLIIPISPESKPINVIKTVGDSSPDQVDHLVDIGETLYAISKKYGVSVEDLRSWNNLTSNDLDVGQKLIVKISDLPEEVTQETVVPTPAVEVEPKETKYHIVGEKETLYSISRTYNVQVEDLRKWNNLSDNSLSVGQRLAVQTDLPIVAQTEDAPPAVTTTAIETTSDSIPETPAPVEETTPTIYAANVTEFNSRVVKDGELEKVLEEGLATVIENSTETKKYLALHRTADIGTVLRVQNLMTKLTIYVRVVGKLPDTGENNKILLKISHTAYERLGGIDKQFPVEISYVP